MRRSPSLPLYTAFTYVEGHLPLFLFYLALKNIEDKLLMHGQYFMHYTFLPCICARSIVVSVVAQPSSSTELEAVGGKTSTKTKTYRSKLKSSSETESTASWCVVVRSVVRTEI